MNAAMWMSTLSTVGGMGGMVEDAYLVRAREEAARQAAYGALLDAELAAERAARKAVR